ncbi:SirB2 family protein [Microbulbifer hainanensis]|uniref:SirB2 family protein n=1 Tax=Microbulbifer hainanensis TaxID=2735675 RepID=UPI0018682BC5|nr:SirB2 family protein [Microbulbifer hainanensis]
MDYPTLKLLHITLAMVSGSGFALRVGAHLSGADWVRHRLARTVPHLIDTALLASAIGLLWMWQWTPLTQPWLQAKLAALVGYVLCGAMALRSSPAQLSRSLTFATMAAACFLFIVSAAVSKRALLLG